MKKFTLLVAYFAWGLVFTAIPVQAQSSAGAVKKKGVGLAERRGKGEAQLSALNVSWYYNWGSETAIAGQAQFVPMIFSLKRLDAKVAGDFVLGFNEPDHEKQSNIPVEDALAKWPAVAAKAKFVGSPSTAHDAADSGWMHRFMEGNPKVDFVTVHWYRGVNPKLFIKDIERIHRRYGKPVWITEFAPQTAGSSAKEPHKYSQEQVSHFITETVRWMEGTPWVQRYAWHDSGAGTSALFDQHGALTATGKAYAAAIVPRP